MTPRPYGRRRNDRHVLPVSERLRAAMLSDDEGLIDRVAELEEMELALEHAQVKPINGGIWGRAYAALKEFVLVVVAVAGLIWFLSGQWTKHEQAVEQAVTQSAETAKELRAIRSLVETLSGKVDGQRRDIQLIERSDEYYRRNPIRTPRLPAGGS